MRFVRLLSRLAARASAIALCAAAMALILSAESPRALASGEPPAPNCRARAEAGEPPSEGETLPDASEGENIGQPDCGESEEADDTEEGDGADAPVKPAPKPRSAAAKPKQPYIRGNLVAAGIIKELEAALDEEIAGAKRAFGMPDDTRVSLGGDNMCDVLALYAVLYGRADGFPYALSFPDPASKRAVAELFRDMAIVGFAETGGAPDREFEVRVIRKTALEAYAEMGLSGGEGEILRLTTDSMRRKVASIRGGSIISRLGIGDFRKIRSRIPEGTSDRRRAALTAALSLEGKVSYLWGGKSEHVGWDDSWGSPVRASAKGSAAGGKAKANGLDCSGFVGWSIVNAFGDRRYAGKVGRSVAEQWEKSYPVKWEDALPGDLVFIGEPGSKDTDHSGLLLSVDSRGKPLVVHCSSSRNGVIVTGKERFKYVRRPYVYGD